jgi:hypothetical protein
VDVSLADENLVDRLAVAERDRPERAGEGAVELKRDVLVDDERAVRGELDGDVGPGKRERLRLRGRGNDERGDGRG